MSLHQSKLHEHINDQQVRAMHLQGILEALEILDNEGVAPSAVTSLIIIAKNLATEINEQLDSAVLPKGGEA